MKRIFLLCLSLLLLSGCSANLETPTSEDVAEKELSIAMEDSVVVSDLNGWKNFLLLSDFGERAEISISRTYDAETYYSTLSYDGEKYTLTEEDGVRSYKHLVYSCQNMPAQSKYDFAEYYLLSDDPEMTAERYFSHLASSMFQPDFPATTVVYTDYMSFDRAEEYGIPPAKYTSEENLSLLYFSTFCQKGFYREQVISLSDSASSALSETVRKCYSYDFKPLEDGFLPEEDWACKGYHKGKPIAYDDKLFDPQPTDRLPDIKDENGAYKVYSRGVFDYGEGYILVRIHHLGLWKLNSPVRSYSPSYCELILTAYDAEGNALWQTTSDIFVV